MQTKILLDEEQIPKQWYNVQADLPSLLDPPLNPWTQKPIVPEDLAAIFPAELIRQEVTTDRHVDIPEEVTGRPPTLEAKPPVPCPPAGEIPEDAGKDLLQMGRGQPGGEPSHRQRDGHESPWSN